MVQGQSTNMVLCPSVLMEMHIDSIMFHWSLVVNSTATVIKVEKMGREFVGLYWLIAQNRVLFF